MSAIKNLRDFRSSKSAPHEQIIELAMAVQKCTTELRNIGAVDDLLGDRESSGVHPSSYASDYKRQMVRQRGPRGYKEEG